MARLSTHVLDTSRGRPANGVQVVLSRGSAVLARALTNADGRAVLVESGAIEAGTYELTFSMGPYFETGAEPPFLQDVVVRFGIADGAANHHIPLLVSPYGYTTYRGS